MLFGYLLLCIAAGVILEAITSWPIGSMVIVIAVFYVLLVFLGAAIVRPIATMTMIVFKGTERENRRDVRRGRRRGASRTQSLRPARLIRRRRGGPDGPTAETPPRSE